MIEKSVSLFNLNKFKRIIIIALNEIKKNFQK